MEATKKQIILSRAALVGLTLIWGFAFVVMKNTLEDLDATELLAIRFLIATLVPAVISGKRLFKVTKRALYGAIFIGISTGLAYTVQNIGLTYTTPGKNAFLTTLYCIATPFLCWAVYKKRPQKKNIIAAVICMAGIALISLESLDIGINKGDVYSFFGGLCFAVQIVLIEEYQHESDIFTITAIQFFTASLTCLIIAFIFRRPFVSVPGSAWVGILYLGFLSSTLCNLLQLYGQKYTPPSQASVMMSLESVFAALFSFILGMEKASFPVLLGFVLIFASVLINELDLKKKIGGTE